MATRLHIGAKELHGSIAAYAKRFDLLEVRTHGAVAEGPRRGAPDAGRGPRRAPLAPTPTHAALRRWRKEVPPHFEFAVMCGPALSTLKPGAAYDADLAEVLEAARILQARCIVLSTPKEVTPSPLSRERMARTLERFPRDATQIVWEPHGLWEADDAARAGRKWGVVVALDAAKDELPAGPVAYTRLRALGETRSFGEAALARVMLRIGAARRDAYVIIETTTALDECKVLRRLAQGGKSSARGGMARVVRPRALTVAVGDDEQE